MTRLIDADELKTIKSIQSADFNSVESIQRWIDSALTAEQPHGKWIVLSIDDNDNISCRCSACGAGDVHSKSVNVPYCWHCGAEMEADNA